MTGFVETPPGRWRIIRAEFKSVDYPLQAWGSGVRIWMYDTDELVTLWPETGLLLQKFTKEESHEILRRIMVEVARTW